MIPNQPMPQGAPQSPVQPQVPPQAMNAPPQGAMPPQAAPTPQQLMLAQALSQAAAQQAARQAQPNAPVVAVDGTKFDPSKDSKGNVTVKAVNASGTDAAKSTVSPSGKKVTTQEAVISPAAGALSKALISKTTREAKTVSK